MGMCMSKDEHKGAKERSVMIDKQLEEDNRKYKKECKILLLGELVLLLLLLLQRVIQKTSMLMLDPLDRLWRIWQVDYSQANEDYTPKWLLFR
jgi:hypothetical protein